jgi:diguanylate cyclase (GGDEF)-like protein
MIRVYTTSSTNAEAVEQAAAGKDTTVEILNELDRGALASSLADTAVIVFDLTSPEMNADRVLAALDILDLERVPPILYILADPSEVELITQSVSMLNQDYAFMPLDPRTLSNRLDVLLILGARRKLTMESAITDRLTGLYNRKYYLRRLEEEMYRSRRYDYEIAIHLVEVDFSAPGSKLTEAAGTIVMQQVGAFFKDRLRKSDQVARFKWDSFAVLLPDIVPEDSMLVAKDVKAKLEGLGLKADGLDVQIKVAVSHMMLPQEGIATTADAIAALEDALLVAKTEPEGIAAAANPA